MNTENKAEAETLKTDSSEDIPEDISEILKNIPQEKRESALVQSVEMIGRYSPESVVLKKITPEHITKYLSDNGENMRLGYQERKQNKVFIFAIVVVALVFFTFLIILLKDQPALLENEIYAVGGLIAGAFGGYGVGKHRKKDDD